MNRLNASDAISPILSRFKVFPGGNRVDIRESIALVDFHLKIIYTLCIAFSRRPQCESIQMSSAPGFGTMLGVIRQSAKHPMDMGTPWIRELVVSWSTKAVAAIDRFKPPRYKTFKSLRDRLAHGQPLPSSQEVLNPICDGLRVLIDGFEAIFKEQLNETEIVASDGRVHIHKKKERAAFEISPFWTWSEEFSGLRIYSHAASDGIHYIESNGDIWSECVDTVVSKFIKTYIGNSSSPSQIELNKLVKDVVADVAAYTEDYSRPSYSFGDEDDVGILYVPWTRSMSEGNESRTDAFRIGLDNRREWRGPAEVWLAYSDFLKSISNWEILARRVAIGLESFSQERFSEESSRLGLVRKTAPRGPSLLKRHRENNSPSGGQGEYFDLMRRIDESCQIIKPSTSVFFLIGQAGLGKTELMVSLSKERARFIESEPSSVLPLYLFVSSTGRTLSSLKDAVDSALNITKILSNHSAKALCRNGLLVLLVDGFDELLGSSGYENALGSLEPWFRELGGRGLLVASARSSYYLTQYRRSLAQAVNLNVDHTLAELQPWSRSASETYLLEMGVNPEIFREIKDRDWRILSVPFFAKAFSAWIAQPKEKSGQSSHLIYEIVVDQYLEREARKLTDPNAGPLLSVEELRELFSETAELMQQSRNREIEQSDLISCAEAVVGSSNLDASRPGLTRRLSSLCGLGVSTDSSGQNQFSFSHEVLFDCFLCLAMQRKISGVINAESFLRLFASSAIDASVFEWLIEKKPDAIKILAQKISFKVPEEGNIGVLSANLGALWGAMLIHRKGVPATEVASGLQLGLVELAKTGWINIDLSRSTVAHIIVPDATQGRIDISYADIAFLETNSSEQARFSLKGVDLANIQSIRIGNQYGDGRNEVREILEEAELLARSNREGDQRQRDAAKYFLDRLKRRPDVPVILDRDDLRADDQRLSWIDHFDIELWRGFINALELSDVGELVKISTAGRPKVRLAFKKSVVSVLDQLDDSQEIINFWKRF